MLQRRLSSNLILEGQRVQVIPKKDYGPKDLHHQLVKTEKDVFALCRYCQCNHWSDQCEEFQTIQDRKQKIKDSCFLCLNKGHIAHRCLRNKTCFYCGHSNNHHRSLCPKKFKSEENESNQEETQQIRYCQTSDTVQNCAS